MAIQSMIYSGILAVLGHIFYRLVVVRYRDYKASVLDGTPTVRSIMLTIK